MASKSPSRTENEHKGLSRMVLSDQVKQYIMDAILNGTYEAGDRIVESALAQELGVSQAPVREAMRELVVMGFLATEPYKGTSVRVFTAQELHEVYTVRAALESLAGREAATRMTDEDLEGLRTIYDDMVEAAYQDDVSLMVQHNNLFHNTILEISDNKLLYKLYQTLEFARWTIFSTIRSGLGLVFLAERHETLLDALATRDPDIAATAMRNHIEELGSPLESLHGGTAADV